MNTQLDFKKVSPKNVWSYFQNNPEYVVNDLVTTYPQIDADVVRQSLMARGVNKWLKVRRDLIAHKKVLKNKMREISESLPALKEICTQSYCNSSMVVNKIKTVHDLSNYYRAQNNYLLAKAKFRILSEERKSLKGLCMTERWQVWKDKHLKDMNTIHAGDLCRK